MNDPPFATNYSNKIIKSTSKTASHKDLGKKTYCRNKSVSG
jgi:hypothetical protein